MAKNNIVTTSIPPNLIGQADVQFRGDDFDALVYSKGYAVIHEAAVPCPCKSQSNGSPLSNCQNCYGTGWVLFNPNKTRMVLQSLNLRTKYNEWSKDNIGTVTITSRNVDKISYMDRLTVEDSNSLFSQILYPKVYSNTLFAFTIYDILSIEELFLFREPNLPLERLSLETDYSFEKNKIILNDSFRDIENLTISVRYHHNLQYHVLELTKETRRSYISNADTKGKDQSIVLPFSGIARLSHYVLDSSNFEGNNIIDNSYLR